MLGHARIFQAVQRHLGRDGPCDGIHARPQIEGGAQMGFLLEQGRIRLPDDGVSRPGAGLTCYKLINFPIRIDFAEFIRPTCCF
ncbi:hypothetical protein C660_05717 [Alcaligenes sp. HPC1271]|nr:hypothetical protein C660_05717 [Alcaligenes sp. HPC1271]